MTLHIEPQAQAENHIFLGTLLNVIKKVFAMFKRSLLLNIKFEGCSAIQKRVLLGLCFKLQPQALPFCD